MQSAKEIIDFQFSAHDFGASAKDLVSERTQRKLEGLQHSFEKVIRQHGTYDRQPEEYTAAAYYLFEEHYPSLEELKSAFDTKRMVGRLSWALCYREDGEVPIARHEKKLRVALLLLEARWSWNSVSGVYDTLLRHWDCSVTRPILQQFINKKLKAYEGKRTRLLRLQDKREDFVKSDGPTKIANSFLKQGKEVTALFDRLRLPDHAKGYPYVAEVGASYTRSAMRSPSYLEHVEPILEFLALHDRQRTYKRCLSQVILRLDRAESSDEREKLLSVSFRKIGDPAHAPEWAPWKGASESNQNDLQSARKTLNRWIAQQFITVFFDKVAMDSDRQQFWLRYAPHVKQFKVFGDWQTEAKLKQDTRIQKYVGSRFDRVSGNMAALLMHVGTRIVLEFGETGGACYLHRPGAAECPSFDKKYRHIRQLRLGTDFPLLMRYSGTRYYAVKEEGRFLHQHDWERRLDWWMQKRLGIEV